MTMFTLRRGSCTMMNARRFGWALRARGPDVAAWPERDRAAAVYLLRHDYAARTLLAEALAAEDAPTPDAAAQDRVVCLVHRALAPLSPFMRGIRWGAFAACLGAGLYLGAVTADVDSVADLQALLHPSMPATVLAALEN